MPMMGEKIYKKEKNDFCAFGSDEQGWKECRFDQGKIPANFITIGRFFFIHQAFCLSQGKFFLVKIFFYFAS